MAAEALIPFWKRKSQKMMNDFIMTESEMEAAQHLIQLSDEDNNCCNTISSKKRTRDEEEVDQIRLSDITSTKIREIFGEEDLHQEAFQPKKQTKKYRSLVNIYMATTPIINA